MNKNKRMKNPSVSVAIPTYESGESLVVAVRSILSQTSFSKVNKIIVVVDGKPMRQTIKKKIHHKKVKIVQRTTRVGQSGRLQDIFQIAKTELIIVTNDDVVLGKNVVSAFIDSYKTSKTDFFTGEVIPFQDKNLLKRALAISYEINAKITAFLHGNTYLSSNGRLIALTKKFYKNVKIPKSIQNNDAYLYFCAKFKKYKHSHVPGANAYFHLPKNIKEHIKQSYKFQLSLKENQQYFSRNLKNEYIIPKKEAFRALFTVLIKKPFLTISYIGVLFYSRVISLKKVLPNSGIWETDISTKAVSLNERISNLLFWLY